MFKNIGRVACLGLLVFLVACDNEAHVFNKIYITV